MGVVDREHDGRNWAEIDLGIRTSLISGLYSLGEVLGFSMCVLQSVLMSMHAKTGYAPTTALADLFARRAFSRG